MTDKNREELISAYLDGELAEEERARVELLLAEDPSLRQLYDELRALSSDLRSLARHKLDHDLSGAVLRRAEQAVLRGSSEPKPVAGVVRPARAVDSWWKRGAGWRRIAWPAAAVAAALAILLYDAARRPAERGVAQAPAQEEREADFRGEGPADEVKAELGAVKESPVERRLDESERLENMPRSAAKPAAAAPALSPLSADRERFMDLTTDGFAMSQRLGFECSPKYMTDRTFEKLLDEKKVMWRRVADEAAKGSRDVVAQDRPLSAELDDLKKAKDAPRRATYIVDAPQDNLNEILGELEKNAKRVDTSSSALFGQAQGGQFFQRRSAAASAGDPRSVIIMLFSRPEVPPPAPAEKNP